MSVHLVSQVQVSLLHRITQNGANEKYENRQTKPTLDRLHIWTYTITFWKLWTDWKILERSSIWQSGRRTKQENFELKQHESRWFRVGSELAVGPLDQVSLRTNLTSRRHKVVQGRDSNNVSQLEHKVQHDTNNKNLAELSNKRYLNFQVKQNGRDQDNVDEESKEKAITFQLLNSNILGAFAQTCAFSYPPMR